MGRDHLEVPPHAEGGIHGRDKSRRGSSKATAGLSPLHLGFPSLDRFALRGANSVCPSLRRHGRIGSSFHDKTSVRRDARWLEPSVAQNLHLFGLESLSSYSDGPASKGTSAPLAPPARSASRCGSRRLRLAVRSGVSRSPPSTRIAECRRVRLSHDDSLLPKANMATKWRRIKRLI